MSKSLSSFLLMGLPGTGKSTYLAALDEVLETSDDPNGLKSDGFAEDRVYLQSLRNAWLGGEIMPRSTIADAVVTLRAKDSRTGQTMDLVLPDLMGESFRKQCEQREWEDRYRDRLSEIDGLLFFLHGGESARSGQIPQKWPLGVGMPDSANKRPIIWENKHAAPQVKMVELFQFISEVTELSKPLKVAVMISAWDIIRSYGEDVFPQNPNRYIQEQLPLLHQYLSYNPEQFTYRAYGVSARGGDSDDTERLLALESPKDRVMLVDGNEISKDLTRPLRWLMETEG